MTDGDQIVLDASAMVDLMVGHRDSAAIGRQITNCAVHVPAHFDAEVLSVLARLCRAGRVTVDDAAELIAAVAAAPVTRHTLEGLVTGAWSRRDNLRLVDALYVELAERLGVSLLTTDTRLAGAYRRARLLV